MRKKLTTLLLAMAMCVTGIFGYSVDAQAEELIEKDIEYSELQTEDALVGYMESQTWGAYLAGGHSTINDAGNGYIGVGGMTVAATSCKVAVTAIVERLSSGSWVRVTSYTASKTSATVVTVSKSLLVSSGYYYRVRCTHYASTDASTSCTGALWM